MRSPLPVEVNSQVGSALYLAEDGLCSTVHARWQAIVRQITQAYEANRKLTAVGAGTDLTELAKTPTRLVYREAPPCESPYQ